MADIVKKEHGQLTDPFQMMREMMRWDPFRQMAPLMPALERGWSPTFEVRETNDAFVFKADVPGIKQDDLQISLTGSRLQISGKRDEEKETKADTFYTYERSYGNFTRSFTLPDGVDTEHVKTELREGVLTLVIPKRAEALARKIPITTAAKS